MNFQQLLFANINRTVFLSNH